MSMDVWRESTLSSVIRVGHIVSGYWLFTSDHTYPGHVAASLLNIVKND